MTQDEKAERLQEMKEQLQGFCQQHLNEELTGYVMKLCDKLGRKRTISITRGRPEIWAASIVYVIARLNFLFDKDNPLFLTPDTICGFFGTKKSTVGNKATQIEEACDIRLGEEGLCSPNITDVFTFYQTPEGFILPKSAFRDPEVKVAFVDGEEARELKAFMAEQRRKEEREEEERRKRRIEINRMNAEKKMKEKYKNQGDLFEDMGTE